MSHPAIRAKTHTSGQVATSGELCPLDSYNCIWIKHPVLRPWSRLHLSWLPLLKEPLLFQNFQCFPLSFGFLVTVKVSTKHSNVSLGWSRDSNASEASVFICSLVLSSTRTIPNHFIPSTFEFPTISAFSHWIFARILATSCKIFTCTLESSYSNSWVCCKSHCASPSS